jgi:hypothetical protein
LQVADRVKSLPVQPLQNNDSEAPCTAASRSWLARIGGYRVSHDRADVTAGNETPGWPSPAPGGATTTSSAIPGLASIIMLVCGL